MAPASCCFLGRELDLGAERLEERSPFEAHARRHREDAAVAAPGGDERQTDARVAAGRLHDDAARFEVPAAFRGFDHREADPILHRAARIRRFRLCPDRSAARPIERDLDERRVADQIEETAVDPRVIGEWGKFR